MSPVEETYLDIAKGFESQGNYEKALSWFRKIQDDAEVYETIGEYLYQGRGCGKDKQEAKNYLEKAAMYQRTDAMCNLALCEEELEDKLYWYRKAAEEGDAYAMNMAGIIVEDMDSDNYDESVSWFKKAAEAGSEVGCYNYAMNIDDSDEKIKYLELAVDKDYLPAMEKYAEYLKHGIYCEKDPVKADKLLSRIEHLKRKEG